MARIAVIGGGVAGLSTAWHLLELWEASPQAGQLHLSIFAPLTPTGGDGSGLGGKAMSRSFEGRYDMARGGADRIPFYGPMMPEKGNVPHGYHVLWAYPNLRRMLGDSGDGMQLLVPAPRPGHPGGAGVIASFQGRSDDPSPGGPGVALVGLVDPAFPDSARSPTSAALFRIQKTMVGKFVLYVFKTLFKCATGIDPLVFVDLIYAHEMDLELRLCLIGASITARHVHPERDTQKIQGKSQYLTDLEYDVYTEAALTDWSKTIVQRLKTLMPLWDTIRSGAGLVEEQIDRSTFFANLIRKLSPDAIEEDVLLVLKDTDRVLRGMPLALAALSSGSYPVWKTLHFRFAPDATFSSPYSFDAASAMRSLAFCFLSPAAGRAWTPDGGRIRKLWLRMWQRLKDKAAADPRVQLEIIEGRVSAISEKDGIAEVFYSGNLGHFPNDLGMPHAPDRHAHALPAQAQAHYEVVVPAVASELVEDMLKGPEWEAAHQQLAPLRGASNETLEVMLWLRQPIDWSPVSREALSHACITGLEGAFCLLADYSCGLWSPAAMAEENPFGEAKFQGSILESCGGFDDLFACPTRDDAYGWPKQAKVAIRDLLSKPEYFSDTDARPWVYDDAGWQHQRAGGTWRAEWNADPQSAKNWVLASRWLVWGWLRQLSCIQSLGARATRQLAALAKRLDPNLCTPEDILNPPDALRQDIRYVVMRSTKTRNRIFSPGLGAWKQRPISGKTLEGSQCVYPAGDWTRNGLDIVSMEAACLSGMRAARGSFSRLTGLSVPQKAPSMIPVLPEKSWYEGLDPNERGR